MLDLSPEKIFVLGILALVVLGPNRLPGAARTLGHIVGQLRSMSTSFQTEVRDALREPGEAVSANFGELTDLGGLRPGDLRRNIRKGVTDLISPPPSSPGALPAVSATSTPAPSAPAPAGAVPSWSDAAVMGTPDDPNLN